MAESQSASFRPKRVNFAQISNVALHDSSLSLKAKGLYALIQSIITIPGIDLKISKIRGRCKEGDKAFDSAWKELKDAGYLKQDRIPNGLLQSGKRGYKYAYDLLDNPDPKSPAAINLDKHGNAIPPKKEFCHTPQKGVDGEMPVSDTSSQSNDSTTESTEKDIDHTPHFGPGAKGTPCETHPVRNGGDNSNTKSGNTLSGNTPVGNTLSVSLPPEDTDRSTDEVRSGILEQIEYDWIEEWHPDYLKAAKALVDCMVEMETVPFTRISGVKQSRYALKKRLDAVSAEDVMCFLDHMRGVKPKNIRNINAYWKSAFINYLGEQDLALSTV